MTTAQQKQQGKQTSSNWDATIDVDGELFEEAEWDTVEPPVLSSIEARQRIEILREERQLQQALEDSFDF